MRILDLFCGAGGSAVGYHRAFPDAEIVGVDINPQPRYPFTFHQGDAMVWPLDGFDLIHASPPCQDWSTLSVLHASHGTGWMLAATVARLRETGTPWVVENVVGSESAMGGWFFALCGSSFGLKVRRHRNFATSFLVLAPPCSHAEQGVALGVYGSLGNSAKGGHGVKAQGLAQAAIAMGIDWMNSREIVQAIPPAYTQYIGEQFALTLEVAA